MSVMHAIVLGIVQGLTEFLPVSSSAHLIIVPWLFGWDDPGLAFDAAIHLGTLAAAIAYFWRDLWAMLQAVPRALRRPWSLLRSSAEDVGGMDAPDQAARLALLIVIATIPGGLAGLLGESAVDSFFHSGDHRERGIILIAVALILLAGVFSLAERLARRQRGLGQLELGDGVTVGIAQATAIVPGISRSGATIAAGLFRGLQRADAARYSFLLGIPIIAGAGSKKLLDVVQAGMTRGEVDAFAAGMLTSAVVGFFAIWWLLRYLQRATLGVFIGYRILLGVSLLALVALR